MDLPLQKYREIQFLLLFCLDHSHSKEADLVPLISKELKVAKSHVLRALTTIAPIQEKIPEIDKRLAAEIKSYQLNRVHAVERSVLRLGVYELLYSDSIPPKVAISEAIRLSKKFGTPASVLFVNAILDHIYKIQKGEDGDLEKVEEAIDAYHEEEKPS